MYVCIHTHIYTYIHTISTRHITLTNASRQKFWISQMHHILEFLSWYSTLQCIAVCCSVLQCVVVCCSVLQCFAACCTMLQCVAECLHASYTRIHVIIHARKTNAFFFFPPRIGFICLNVDWILFLFAPYRQIKSETSMKSLPKLRNAALTPSLPRSCTCVRACIQTHTHSFIVFRAMSLSLSFSSFVSLSLFLFFSVNFSQSPSYTHTLFCLALSFFLFLSLSLSLFLTFSHSNALSLSSSPLSSSPLFSL